MLGAAPRDPLSNLHKEGAFEITIKDETEAAFELHLWFHLFMKSLMHKCVQIGSPNAEPDAVLEGGLKVALEREP